MNIEINKWISLYSQKSSFSFSLPGGLVWGGEICIPPPFLSPFHHFFSPTCHLAIFLKSEKYTPLQKCALRCSQPLSGINGRSPEDEAYINCILESNPAANYLYIVDTRPKINAMYNRSVMYTPQLPLHRRHKAQDKRYLQQVSYVPLTTQPQKYVLCIHYTVSTYCVPITNMIWTSICTTCTLYKYGQRSALCTTDQLFTVFCTHFILCIHFTVHILFLLLQIWTYYTLPVHCINKAQDVQQLSYVIVYCFQCL